MYIKNKKSQSKLSEFKHRKKLARKSKKQKIATIDNKLCENCTIPRELNYCTVLFDAIKVQYQFFDDYFKWEELGTETKQYLNYLWAEVRHSENSLKDDKVIKQCPLLRKKLNDYLNYRDKFLKAYKYIKHSDY